MNQYTLNLVATSDIHGYILPLKYADNSYANIGLAKISTLVSKLRTENETILIDNGDILQGSPLAYYNAQISIKKRSPISDVLNYMKYDVSVVGNHDFNYGLDYLNEYRNSLNCPLLSANITNKDGSHYFTPYFIKELSNGIRIAIIGVTTKYIPNWERYEYIKDLEFLDAHITVKKIVNFINEREQVDCIVVSYHGGFCRDIHTGIATEELTGENQGFELLKVDGIDCLITGHQHRSLHEDNIMGKAITQTASNGKEVALIQLQFEKINHKWKVLNKKTELLTTENYDADLNVLNIVKDIEIETQKWLDEPLGIVREGDLIIKDQFQARVKKHPLVSLINQVQMDAGGVDLSITSLGNEIYGLNQSITMRNIISTYVFQNTLVILEVTGQDIKDALEKSANYFTIENDELKINHKYNYPKPQHYNYDMYDGISYEIHVREKTGHKIKNLIYKEKPLKLDQTYHVIMNNYRANGGGNFNMYKNKKRIKEINTDMVELLANYVKKVKVIDIKEIDNIRIIY